MIFVFIAIAILNLLDGVFTYYGLSHHYITEGNPLMDMIWQISPLLFIAVKLFFSAIAFFIGWKFKVNRIVPSMLIKFLWIAALGIYIWIMCLHAIWIKIVLFG